MRNTSPVGWRVTRYDYINRQLYNGADGLGYLQANPPDLWLSADKGLATVGARVSDGTSQSITCGFVPQLGTSSFSVEIFYYPKSNAFYQYPMGCGAGSVAQGGFHFGKSTNGVVYFKVGNKTNLIDVFSNKGNTLNTWNHLVGVVDRPNNQVRFYHNGDLQGITAIASTDNLTGTAQLGIGFISQSTNYAGEALNGCVSRARLALGYAYQTSDVEATWNNGNGLLGAELSSDLLARITDGWNLNEPSGRAVNFVTTNYGIVIGASTEMGSTDGPRESIVADNSGNDYHLKLVNYSASQKVTNWVTDQAGNEGLKFERASSHYCIGTTNHIASGTTEGFKVGSILVKCKWDGNSTIGYDPLMCIGVDGTYDIFTFMISNAVRNIRATYYPIAGSTYTYTFSTDNSVVASTSYMYLGMSINGNEVTTDMYIRVYINGVESLKNKVPWINGYKGAALNAYKWVIGTGFGATNYFGGTIDYARVWNVALSASDFLAMYNGSTPATAPVMNYRFNDGPQESGVSNGDSIAGWKSREGRNYEFNQGTLANRPTWVANANHGQPGILFDGTNDYLQCTQRILSGTSGIIFAVTQLSSSAVSNVYSQATTLNSNHSFTLNLSTNVQVSHRFNSTTIYGLGTITLSTLFNLIVLKGEGSSYSNRVNAKNDIPFSGNGYWAGSTFASSDMNNSAIGAWVGAAISFPYNGRIAELIAYDGIRTPSTNAILAIERYLLTKYGIST